MPQVEQALNRPGLTFERAVRISIHPTSPYCTLTLRRVGIGPLNPGSFVSGIVNRTTFKVGLDSAVLQTLCDRAGMSQRFLSDVYTTEEWTKLDVSHHVANEKSESPTLGKTISRFYTETRSYHS